MKLSSQIFSDLYLLIIFSLQAFEYQQASHGRNTAKVLQDYTQRQGSTVNEVIEALKEIDRPDALKEVEESMQGKENSLASHPRNNYRYK